MQLRTSRFPVSRTTLTFSLLPFVAFGLVLSSSSAIVHGADSEAGPTWRQLPLVVDGKVDDGWGHVGWGGFVVDDGALRTEYDPKGLGLLFYKRERFGNCQIR